MAVYDRWHKDPADGDQPCKCRNGRGGKLYASAAHLKGRRWQVRWDDPNSATRRQPRRNFALKDGDDPNVHADAFDKEIQGRIIRRAYTDPRAGEVLLMEYAETWRTTRGHNEESAAKLAARLLNHVYPDPAAPKSGKAPRGALAIGQHPLALLAQRPSLLAAWVVSLKVPLPAERSRRMVTDDVSAILAAALDDGAIGRNPLKSATVDLPGRSGPKAKPFTPAEVDAIAGHLPERLAVLPRLGAGTGMRLMELAALGVHDVQFLGKRPHVTVERQLKRIGGQLVFAPLKNRKPHTVPLSPGTAAALTQHLADHPPAEVTLPWHDPGTKEHGKPHTVRLVLLGDDGGALTRAAVSSAWRTAAAKAAGVTKRDDSLHLVVTGMNPHRLRHTYASVQLRKGVDVVRVAAAMGDTVDVLVKTYAHLLRDDDGDTALRDAVDDFFRPRAPDVPSERADDESAQASGT